MRARGAKSRGARISSDVVRIPDMGLSAVGSATAPPPARPAPGAHERARSVVLSLRACGPEDEAPAVQSLLQLGSVSLEAVAEEFPGLLWFHRKLAHQRLPRGRDTGPLARVLIAFGEESVPYVVRFMLGGSEQRYYATLLAADLREACGMQGRMHLVAALGGRLRDPERDIADVALHALLQFDGDPALDALSTALRDKLSRDLDPAERLFAIRSLGVLRRADALPEMVASLEDTDPSVRDAAPKVLRLLTAVDLGASRRKWTSWLDQNRSRHRLEWLLDGLMHRTAALRTIAHRELERTLKTDVGYSAEAGRWDRKSKQAAYRRQVEDWLHERARESGPEDPMGAPRLLGR